MQAFITLHVPDGLALSRPCTNGDVIGRDAGCAICVEHVSVSRKHARLRLDDDAQWHIDDLDSKNGLRRDGARMLTIPLAPGNWFAIGDVYARFELLDDQQANARATNIERRRTQSQTMRALLHRDQRIEGVVERGLADFVKLAECRRGFVLLGDGRGPPIVRAALRLDAGESDVAQFDGSLGAVERCFRDRRAVFLSNLPDAAWLRARPSVVAGGVRALACLPMLDGGELLGALYADTDDATRIFDELDAELLEAFSGEVAAWIAASMLDARVDALAKRVADRTDGTSSP